MPAALTATAGVKAGLLLRLLTTAGLLQVVPPSVDLEITTWLTVPPVNRASSQTTYRFPLLASMAAEGRPAPVRRSAPVFGAKSFTVCWFETIVVVQRDGKKATGVFGMLGPVHADFGFVPQYPLATLPIDVDLLQEKWALTHPAFASEKEEKIK